MGAFRVFCGSGFPAAIIESRSFSHKESLFS